MVNLLKRGWKYPVSGSQLFLLALVVYIVPTVILETMYIGVLDDHLMRLISYLALPILLLKFYLIDEWNWKFKLFSVFIILILGVIWRLTQNNDILLTGIFLLASQKVDFKKIVKVYFYLIVTTIIIVIIVALLKIIPNLIFRDPTMTRVDRYSLGFSYPTLLASHVLFASLAYFYLRFGNIKFFDYVGVLLVASIVMKFTDTRMDFYATILMVPLIWMAQYATFYDGIIRKIVSFEWMATPVLTVVMIMLTYFYQPSNYLLEKINQLISGRLRLGRMAFDKLDPNLFGQYIKEYTFGGTKGLKLANGQLNIEYFYVDSTFVRMFLMWGLIVFVIYLVIMTGIAIIDTLQHRYILATIISIIAINSMLEPHAVQLIYNIFILSMGSVLATIKNLSGEIDNENKV